MASGGIVMGEEVALFFPPQVAGDFGLLLPVIEAIQSNLHFHEGINIKDPVREPQERCTRL